jgi:uncharacterized protein YutD
MNIETKHGLFDLLKNRENGFNLEKFDYLYTDYFDQYEYIVGDIATDNLRLKGFMGQIGPNGYNKIPEYLNELVNWKSPYFILKRLPPEPEEEIQKEK